MMKLACLDRGSRTLLAVQAADSFGISVLHAGQEPIARAFATKAPVAEKWSGVAWSDRDGIPAIDDALIWIACDLRDVLAAGDHVIVTGEVRGLETRAGDPLVFHGGEYRPLGCARWSVAAGRNREGPANIVHARAREVRDRIAEESARDGSEIVEV